MRTRFEQSFEVFTIIFFKGFVCTILCLSSLTSLPPQSIFPCRQVKAKGCRLAFIFCLYVFLCEDIYISGTTTASNLSSSSWEQVGICREDTVKKVYCISLPQPGCHQPNSPWLGIIKFIPGQGEFG
jgi:hypothetical protein